MSSPSRSSGPSSDIETALNNGAPSNTVPVVRRRSGIETKATAAAIAGSAAALAAAAAVGVTARKQHTHNGHDDIVHKATDHEYEDTLAYNTPEVPHKRALELGLVLFERNIDINFFRAVIAEFIATIIFLFNSIVLVEWNAEKKQALGSDRHLLISLSFAFNIFLLVYAFAGMSGANINPAITTCLALGKRISCVRAVCYIGAQCAGAIIGTYLASFVSFGASFEIVRGGANFILPIVGVQRAIVGEIICTGLLCTIVLVGTNGDLYQLLNLIKMDPQLPLAIAVAVAVGHFVLVPIDVCSINPARSLGPAVVNNTWENHWVFWVAPMGGAVGAILLWELILRPPVTAAKYAQLHPNGLWRNIIMRDKSAHEQPLAGRRHDTNEH